MMSIAVGADSSTRTIPLSQTPPAVQQSIQAQLGNGKLGDIQRVEEDNEVTYEVESTQNGHSHDFTVAADGTVIRIEVTLAQTPPAVLKTINSKLASGTLASIEKTFDDGEVAFEVEMVTRSGTERSFTVGADGKLQMEEIDLSETPPAVRKTILENVGKGKLGDIFRTYDAGEIGYDFEVNQDGKDRDFSVSSTGKLESMQMFLEELPAPARRTIKSKLENGKILRIDKMFEEKKGAIPFQIEGRKDGKPFNFSVGPKGRFLGMDE